MPTGPGRERKEVPSIRNSEPDGSPLFPKAQVPTLRDHHLITNRGKQHRNKSETRWERPPSRKEGQGHRKVQSYSSRLHRPHAKAGLNPLDQLDFGVRALWQVCEGLRACPTSSCRVPYPRFLEKWLLSAGSHFWPECAGQRKRMG